MFVIWFYEEVLFYLHNQYHIMMYFFFSQEHVVRWRGEGNGGHLE